MTLAPARRALWVLLLGLLGFGCAALKPIEPHPKLVHGAYVVHPQTRWAASLVTYNPEIWTIDGVALHTLRFYQASAGGQLPGRSDRFPIGDDIPKARRPIFRLGMAEADLAELVVDSVFSGAPRPQGLRPFPFGRAQGFRFDLTFMRGGLEWRALVVGGVVKDVLHVIVYEGAAVNFFPRYLDQVERLIASIETK